MKRLFFIGSFLFSMNVVVGQTEALIQSEASVLNDPKFIELKKRHDQVAEQSGRPKSGSYYMGYDDVLRSYLIGDAIPAEVPKSNDAFTKKQYVALLNDWLSKNRQYLKAEHKNSTIAE